MATRKKENMALPKVQMRGTASVLTPDVAESLRLKEAGLLYNDAQREAERARNAEQLEQVIRRLYGVGGAEMVREEVGKVYSLLGVK